MAIWGARATPFAVLVKVATRGWSVAVLVEASCKSSDRCGASSTAALVATMGVGVGAGRQRVPVEWGGKQLRCATGPYMAWSMHGDNEVHRRMPVSGASVVLSREVKLRTRRWHVYGRFVSHGEDAASGAVHCVTVDSVGGAVHVGSCYEGLCNSVGDCGGGCAASGVAHASAESQR